MTLSELRRIHAIVGNLTRILGTADMTMIDRRIRDWTHTGHSPGQTDGPRTTTTPRPVEHAALTTPETLIAGRTYPQIIREADQLLPLLEQLIIETSRSTHPTEEELRSTELVSEASRRNRAKGVCEACGRECTGTRNDRLVRIDSRSLCLTDYRQVKRDALRGVDTAASIAGIKTRSATWKTNDE